MRLKEQTKVPMILWMNRSAKERYAVSNSQIPQAASGAACYDLVTEKPGFNASYVTPVHGKTRINYPSFESISSRESENPD